MAKLNQVIAIEKGVKSRAVSVISDLYKAIQKPELFNGFVKSFTPKNEDGEKLPTERKHVQARMADVLRHLEVAQGDLIDVMTQKDIANARAASPVLVGDVTVLPELPVTTLLALEKQITDLRAFIDNIPVLDNAEEWRLDENATLYVTEPVETRSTRKENEVLILYPHTPEHPAQTQLVTKDVTTGIWKTFRQSGAMPRPEKDKLRARVEALLIGIKEARERANDITVGERPKVGEAIFNYLLRG